MIGYYYALFLPNTYIVFNKMKLIIYIPTFMWMVVRLQTLSKQYICTYEIKW